LGIEPKAIRRAAAAFQGLEHRLEEVADIGGVRYINDSKATNVDSLRCALEALEAPIVLIAGGRDKEGDFAGIAGLVDRKVSMLVAVGEAREKLRQALSGVTEVVLSGDMAGAVRLASQAAGPGTTVLLSPGCASFDMFEDFEHRGRVFKEIVHELEVEHEADSDG
jgi:UDP-N-acetylmuramoylalanine--D-glutamate ligase